MLDKILASDILTACLSTGGDFAEIFIENRKDTSISMINGVVERANSGLNSGIGIRIFSGFNYVYAYTSDFSRENLIKMSIESAAAIKNNQKTVVLDFEPKNIKNIHLIEKSPLDGDKKQIVEKLKMASDAAYKYNKLITETSCGFGGYIQEVTIINSEGLWVSDSRTRARVSVEAIASDGNEKQTASIRPGGHVGLELLDCLNMEEMGYLTGESAVKILKADLCPSGKMPVIIDKKFGGVIFHEACGHLLEATSVAKGASAFTGKKNQKIASDIVSAVDDGTILNEWGSQNIDDEGTPTRKNILIKDGILNSYLVDKLNGRRMETESTGSGRRESYKFAPTSRMSNTYIDKGTSEEEEIIANTEYGLYAKDMGGGSVQPANGEFNFSVQEAYMIRNGKIAEPVRGATLIGKGPEVLLNIDMIGNKLEHAQGMCGSVSGSVPTNVGQPMIRVQDITVGGRK